jgi:hypothetical protein
VFGGVFVVLIFFWIGVRTAQAQHAMSHTHDRLVALQRDIVAGDSTAANADLHAIAADTKQARARTGGWVFHLVSDVPYFGRTAHTTRTLASSSNELATRTLPAAVSVDAAISPKLLRAKDGTIDLTALPSAASTLQTVESQLSSVHDRLLHTPHGAWVIDPVDRARGSMLDTIKQVTADVSVARRFASVAPAMLGSSGTRRYLIVVQNNNQARGTGGVAEAFAIATARLGQVRLATTGPVATRPKAKEWAQANTSPDFPTAARTWVGLWQSAHHGQRIDGVVGLDPVAFGRILLATGPQHLGRRNIVRAADVVRSTEVRYANVPRPVVRARFLALVTRQVLRSVTTGAGSAVRLANGLGAAGAGGHVRIWSARSEEETVLAETSFGGALSQARVPFAEVVVNNVSGNRVDYFLKRTFNDFGGDCGSARRQSHIVVQLGNESPSLLPAFLTNRTDNPSPVSPIGQTRLAVSIYASAGARIVSANVDGKPVEMKSLVEMGHAVFSTEVTIDGRTTQTLALQLDEPTLPGAVVVPVQPMAFPQEGVIDVPVCRG